jgi:Domain of unknown function (DUF362)
MINIETRGNIPHPDVSRNAQVKIKKMRWLCFAHLISLFVARAALAQSTVPPLSSGPPSSAQVFIVEDSQATGAFETRPDRIEAMVNRAITNLTGRASVPESWRSLVSTQDIVGLKVFSEPGPNSGTRPDVVAAVIRGLLSAGLPPDHIIVWDKHKSDLRLAGYLRLVQTFHITLAGSAEAGYDEKKYYDTALIGNLVWGDYEFGKKTDGAGRKSFVSKLVTEQMTKIINITPMMNHNEAGVSGSLYSLTLGSVDNITRFESDPARLAMAVPEIYALPVFSDRVVLNIVDALICQYEGEERSLLHYSVVLNQIRMSRDPVALDALSIQELDRQRKLNKAPPVKANPDLLSNAALLELGVNDPKKIHVINLR